MSTIYHPQYDSRRVYLIMINRSDVGYIIADAFAEDDYLAAVDQMRKRLAQELGKYRSFVRLAVVDGHTKVAVEIKNGTNGW